MIASAALVKSSVWDMLRTLIVNDVDEILGPLNHWYRYFEVAFCTM